jgi:TAG lipase / lysophosphatidylethanolamine acyltransferase
MASPYWRPVAAIWSLIRKLFLFVYHCVRDFLSLFNFMAVIRTLQARDGQDSSLTFEDWHAAQEIIDNARGVDEWASFPNHPDYNFRGLEEFRAELAASQRRDDYHHVCSRLRALLRRNICRILSHKLYRKSLIQTKRLIQDYIEDMTSCIWYIAQWKGQPHNSWSQKETVLHEVKDRLFGRTCLLLTGGAGIAMCHIGVVKALLQRALLPTIITGISTGSLVASIVGVSTDSELKAVVQFQGINLTAFTERKPVEGNWFDRNWAAFQRRRIRYTMTGHMFDIDSLRRFAKDNLGNMTFEEAYKKTGRTLNIMIAISDVYGTPQLLNYITAPQVLIWSAVVASIATSHRMYATTRILCKAPDGSIEGYRAPDAVVGLTDEQYFNEMKPPLQRLAELFNVNHFVVSQTRPYVFPFLWAQQMTVSMPALGKLVRLTQREILHWLTRPNVFGYPVPIVHRVLLDELVPSSAAIWAKVQILPQVRIRDVCDMFETPTLKSLQKWSRIGEESTWPYLCQLEVRCRLEFEMDRALDSVRRGKDSLVV